MSALGIDLSGNRFDRVLHQLSKLWKDCLRKVNFYIHTIQVLLKLCI